MIPNKGIYAVIIMLFNFTFFVYRLEYSQVTFHVSTLIVSHSQEINKKDVNREYQNFALQLSVEIIIQTSSYTVWIEILDSGDPYMC